MKNMFSGNNGNIILIIGLIVLMFALSEYSNNKNINKLGNSNMGTSQSTSSGPHIASSDTSSVQRNLPTTGASNAVPGSCRSNNYAPVNNNNQPIISQQPANNSPSDLLPRDTNSEWSTMQPNSNLQNVNMLNPEQVVGTGVGSTLRNANLQIRSEPPNPRSNTNCPWNISTIEPDTGRPSLEIGSAD